MKKILSMLLVLVITLSTVTSFAEVRFKDVDKHWAASEINYLADKGIINGVGNNIFRPEGRVGIDEFIKLCVSALGYNYEIGSYQYWATPYINKAIELGLIHSKEFPNMQIAINREEMSSIAVKALGHKKTLTASNLDTEIIQTLADYRLIKDYYKKPAIDAYREGLVKGKGANRFDPKGLSTRAEAAVVIMRILDEKRRTPFKPDNAIPSTLVYYDEWTDAMGWTEVSEVFYAPKNIAGGYEKALTDFYGWAKSTERQPYGFWMARYNPHQKHLGVSCLNSSKLEDATGVEQAEGLVLSFGADLFYFNTKKQDNAYSLVFYAENTKYNDPKTYSSYLNDRFKPYLDQLFELFFESDAAMMRQKFEKYANNLGSYKEVTEEELILQNGRSVAFVVGKDGVTIWFSEKTK